MAQKTTASQQQVLDSELESALNGLIRLRKTLRVYPVGHPALTEAQENAAQAFSPLLQPPEPYLCHISKAGFSCAANARPAANPQAAELAQRLMERQVRQLLFLPQLSQDELLIFVEEISRPAAELLAAGGLSQRLAERRVNSIRVNQTSLVTTNSNRAEAAKETTAGADAPELADFLPAERKDRQQPKADSLLVETMRDLLELFRESLEDSEQQQLLDQLKQVAPEFFLQTGLPGYLAVFLQLLGHQQDQQRSHRQRAAAAKSIDQLLSADRKLFLAAAVADKQLKESQRGALARVLTGLGEKIAPQLSKNLSAEEDSLTRRRYICILARMGKRIFPQLEKSLQNGAWQQVRDAVEILGETRLEAALPLLATVRAHPEPKVRRALIQALHRLGGSPAIPLLVELSRDPVAELQQPAIIALGSLGDPQAVPPLAALLAEADPFGKRMVLKKTAIQAMVSLGSSQAIVPLLKIARRRNLLQRRAVEELRAEAILALGQLGNSHLLPILKRLASSNQGPVSRALKQATSQLEKHCQAA